MEEKPQNRQDQGSGLPPSRLETDDEGSQGKMLPVWFFVGIIFLVYGIIIFVTGLLEVHSPPPTVLSSLHPTIWWGAILMVLGGFYVYYCGPWGE